MAGFRDMIVYQKAFDLSVRILKLTKRFPKEEMFGLTSQIRNSSRSVCANLGEAHRRRRYQAHLVAKLTYSDSEITEDAGSSRYRSGMRVPDSGRSGSTSRTQ